MSAITRSGACLRLGAPGNLRDPADGSQESFSNRGQLVKSSKDLTCRYWRLDPDRCSGLSCPYSHSWTGTMSRPLPYTCARWEAGTCHSSQDLCLYTHGKTTAIPTAPRAMHGHAQRLISTDNILTTTHDVKSEADLQKPLAVHRAGSVQLFSHDAHKKTFANDNEVWRDTGLRASHESHLRPSYQDSFVGARVQTLTRSPELRSQPLTVAHEDGTARKTIGDISHPRCQDLVLSNQVRTLTPSPGLHPRSLSNALTETAPQISGDLPLRALLRAQEEVTAGSTFRVPSGSPTPEPSLQATAANMWPLGPRKRRLDQGEDKDFCKVLKIEDVEMTDTLSVYDSLPFLLARSSVQGTVTNKHHPVLDNSKIYTRKRKSHVLPKKRGRSLRVNQAEQDAFKGFEKVHTRTRVALENTQLNRNAMRTFWESDPGRFDDPSLKKSLENMGEYLRTAEADLRKALTEVRNVRKRIW